MLASDDEPSAECQFHWLPFTAAYWGVAVVATIVAGNAWLLFAFWLANPAILAVSWLLWVKVMPRQADDAKCARRDSNPQPPDP
jgi:hypothetical protein